jgi:D-alanyl-D-alanine carboxypeptidase
MHLDKAFARLDQFVEQKMRADNTPGLALALTDRVRLLHVATYGFADIAARTRVTPDTLFEIGSISKSFTCIALLQLREAGRLDLHQPVARYLPWFQVRSAYEPIALRHLMSHTAGITRGADFDPDSPYEVWALRETEAAHPPGAHFHYSNDAYKALGLILERMLGRQYGQVIQYGILDPLGMTATTPVFTHEMRKRLVVGYRPLYDDRPAHPSHPLVEATWIEYGGGDGSITSTPADMAMYVRMLLNRGQGPRGRILSEESFALMTAPAVRVEEEGEGVAYGYGLGLRTSGQMYIEHGGGMIGYLSALLGDMDDGLGAIVLQNGPGEPSEIAQFALDTLRAELRGQQPPALPARDDPTRVANAADYAGMYHCGTKLLDLAAEGELLTLRHGDARIILERRGIDSFYVDHPDFALFPLRFERANDQVVEAFHGHDWYVGERYDGPTTFEYPQAWVAYPGHYRSHNPWLSNFRIVLRKGALVLAYSWGGEEVLVALDDGTFRVGSAEHGPERIRFEAIVEGRALRANLSGGEYYRFFTP